MRPQDGMREKLKPRSPQHRKLQRMARRMNRQRLKRWNRIRKGLRTTAHLDREMISPELRRYWGMHD